MWGAEPLAVRIRSGEIESVHFGHAALVDPAGRLVARRGDPEALVFARSSLKPVQALPLVLSGACEAYGLSDAAIAVAAASHAGEPAHVAAVTELLARIGLDEAALGCGTHAPLDPAAAAALVQAGASPRPVHCNCSGKHAAMLAVCRHMGWEIGSYRAPDHPLQRQVRSLVAELAGLSPEQVGHGVDGCGLPVWRLSVVALARVFGALGRPDGLRPELRAAATRVASAMLIHPHLVSGTDRLDTALLAGGGGELLAKIGGEGVHAGSVRSLGLGWAIKVGDGHKRAIGPALARLLAEAGVPLPDTPAIATHVAPAVKNNLGEAVGHLAPGW